jgi:hypothetical protein
MGWFFLFIKAGSEEDEPASQSTEFPLEYL